MPCCRCCKHTELARSSFSAWVLGTTPGHWLALLVAGCSIQLLCMLAWVLSGGNDLYGTGTRDSFWISYVLLVDIGTQTGFSSNESGVVRAVAVLISLIGFVYCLTFLGMVVELIRSFLVHWKVKYSKVDAYGHWLILGWGDKTIFLLEELLSAIQREEDQQRWCPPRRRIVVLAERPVRDMQAEVRLHFRSQDPGGQGVYRRMRRAVLYREGCKAHRAELMKVNAFAAEHILIMCGAETDTSSDHEAIRTLLALGALPQPLRAEQGTDVWAEMHQRENARVVNTILDAAQGIVARHAVNHMIILRALVPSVGYAWLRMSTTRSGSQLFLVPVPKALRGFQLQDIFEYFPLAVVCGVRHDGYDAVKKLKTGAHQLQEGDELVVLASSVKTAGHCIIPDVKLERSLSSLSRRVARRQSSVLMDDGQVRLGPAADGPLVVLLIGCPDDFVDILEIIDGYVASKSEVHLLSTKPMPWRQWHLQLHFSRRGQSEFQRIQVVHHVGRRRDRSVLERLPLETADCALILSEREGEMENGLDSDSRNLTIAINLWHVLETMSDVISKKREKSYRKKCKLVTEIQDPKSQAMLAGNGNVRKIGSFVFTSSTETGVFAIAVACKALYDIFIKLIDPQIGSGYVVATPVAKFIDGEEDLSYFEMYRRVFQRCNGTLLGWRRLDERHPVLNPPDKDQPWRWQSHSMDELIILLPQQDTMEPAQPKEEGEQELETSPGGSITSASPVAKAAKVKGARYLQEDHLQIPGALDATLDSPTEKVTASFSLSLNYPR